MILQLLAKRQVELKVKTAFLRQVWFAAVVPSASSLSGSNSPAPQTAPPLLPNQLSHHRVNVIMVI